PCGWVVDLRRVARPSCRQPDRMWTGLGQHVPAGALDAALWRLQAERHGPGERVGRVERIYPDQDGGSGSQPHNARRSIRQLRGKANRAGCADCRPSPCRWRPAPLVIGILEVRSTFVMMATESSVPPE